MKTELEIGKYYQSGNNYVRVDAYDHMLEPIGVMVSFFDGHVDVTKDTELYYLEDVNMIDREITKEEFEAKLDEAQKKLAKLCLEIKNNPTV